MEPTRFGNKYELIDKIAKGGMAEIFLARSLGVAGFEKRIVIKRILPHLCDEETFVEMFLQEARLGAALSHPNIIQALANNKSADAVLVSLFKNGKMAKMADANWKP